MTTTDDLARLAAAAPLPLLDCDFRSVIIASDERHAMGFLISVQQPVSREQGEALAAYIVAACNATPELVARIAATTAALDDMDYALIGGNIVSAAVEPAAITQWIQVVREALMQEDVSGTTGTEVP